MISRWRFLGGPDFAKRRDGPPQPSEPGVLEEPTAGDGGGLVWLGQVLGIVALDGAFLSWTCSGMRYRKVERDIAIQYGSSVTYFNNEEGGTIYRECVSELSSFLNFITVDMSPLVS